MARTVIAHLFSSVNGVSESPNEWQFDAVGPEEGEMLGTTIATVTDAVGSVTPRCAASSVRLPPGLT